MRLFIAEKPSLARAIAAVLPGPQRRAGDHIACGDGNVVGWCAGHILEMAPPEAYGPEFKRWALEQLPIVPKSWKLAPSIPGLVKSLKALLKDADQVVHAGDPDREGQLLVDEVLEFLGYRGGVERLLINDLSPEAVKRALTALEPNQKYRPLYHAALARQRADWLYGMNMTRLYTLLGQAGGHDGVLSVGRVQTPLLGLVVNRDLAIENFRPVPFYVLQATMATSDGATFRADWVPGASAEAHLDDGKRLLNREVADAAAARVRERTGTVVEAVEEKKAEPPPLPYALADLQVDAGKRLGLSAKQVLDACQSLYETHRMTTYPRSDCSYLPEGHLAQAGEVLSAIANNLPSLAPHVACVDRTLRSRAWNDKKITAHHAIIPTASVQPGLQLGDVERAVYELIAQRYLVQFYPAFEYIQTKLEIVVAEERFTANGRQIVAGGWKEKTGRVHPDEGDDAFADDDSASLPPLQQGDVVTVTTVNVGERKTQAPKPFNDATLMQAMCSVASYVTDPAIKKILGETDGIGTPATRAAIIETLFDRGYVCRAKKTIVSTPIGRGLIRILPEAATTPDMTAVWEAAIRGIHDGQQSLDGFVSRVEGQLKQLVEQSKELGQLKIGDAHPCQRTGCAGHLRRLKGKNGHFWSCRACRATTDDVAGKPKRANETTPHAKTPARKSGPR